MRKKKASKIREAQDAIDVLSDHVRNAESTLEKVRELRIRAHAKLSKLVKEADHA